MSSQAQQICPRCDTANMEASKFCGHCGADLSGIATDDTQPHQAILEEQATSQTRTVDKQTGPRHDRRQSDRRRDPWLGQVVDNRYRVIEVVGRGGMGVVYKVEHQRMGKIAAMKVLHDEYGSDRDVVERFHREAEAVSRLNHPNTVQVFDFGVARGSFYLIMEYVRGQNLAALIHRDGPMPFARAAPLLMQICAALTEAHELGVVHRDLKPENVLVTRTHRGRDFIKVLDFGLAKLSERDELADVTERGAIVGTPYYMSPEQIRGEDNLDARADIYSFGAMMYRLLTGAHPFEAKTPMGVVTKHLTAELVPPSRRAPALGIHPRVEELVLRCMAKKPEDRHAGISDVLDALESVFVDICDQSAPLALSWSALSDSRPHRVAQLPLTDSGDEVDYGMLSSVRLQRADLDAFERSLGRRRWLRVALVPVLFSALIGALAYGMMLRAESPRTSEREPNNELDRATLIDAGKAVTGQLGKRIDKSTPDQDYFRVHGHSEAMLATVHVSALPNVDLAVSLVDTSGQVLWHADEGGVGNDEWVRRVRVRDGLHVLVTESMPEGPRLPTENVSDAYTLTVDLEPVQANHEFEPNDNTSDAVVLKPGEAVSGYLDRRSDVDSYRVDAPAGRYQLSIEGAAEVPLTWRLQGKKASTERQAVVEVQAGQIIRLARSDQSTPHDQILPGMESEYTIRLLPVTAAPRQ